MWKQVVTALTVNLLSLVYGISVGWAAPNMLLFQSDKSPIGPLTPTQMSLIVSMLCIGATVGTLLTGFVADIWGRKKVLLLIAVPQIIANILLIVGTNYYYIYGARFLFGLSGGGVFILVPIFVSEISNERIRGALGTFLALWFNTGILVGYILASWMDYYHVPFVSAAIMILFLTIFIWLPESPDYLAHIKKTEEADKSYTFYGNARLRSSVESPQDDTQLEVKPKITREDFKDKAVQKGIVISFVLIIFVDTCGVFVMTNFMTELFHWAKIDLDVYVATIGVGVIQIVGSIITAVTVDRFGRRFLFIFSAFGTALCLYAFGFYFYILDKPDYKSLVEQLQWLPVASLSGAVLIASVAVATLPFFLISEITPVKLRGLINSILLAVSWSFAFIVVQYFHTMVEAMGVSGTAWTYAMFCTVEVVFVFFFLPETKNLTFEEIQQKLRK